MSIELKFELLILVAYFAIRHVWRVFGKPPPSSDKSSGAGDW